MVGLTNVDDTTDIGKPVSTAPEHVAVKVEDTNGKNERCLFFYSS